MHISNLAGALNQLNCGTTTLGDWCHKALLPEHADAAIEGLVEAGICAVFLHGTPCRSPDTPQGPQCSSAETAVADFQAGAARGLIVSMHQSGGEPSPGWEALRAAGLFSSLTDVVHGADLPDDWIKTLVEAGVTFTTTPENELSEGHGTSSSPPPTSLWPTSAAWTTPTTDDRHVRQHTVCHQQTGACLGHGRRSEGTGPGRQGGPDRGRHAGRSGRRRCPGTQPVAGA